VQKPNGGGSTEAQLKQGPTNGEKMKKKKKGLGNLKIRQRSALTDIREVGGNDSGESGVECRWILEGREKL